MPRGVEFGLLADGAMERGRRRAAGERDVERVAQLEGGARRVDPQACRGLGQGGRIGGDDEMRAHRVHQATGPGAAVSAGWPAASQAAVPPMTLTMVPGWRAAIRLEAIAER